MLSPEGRVAARLDKISQEIMEMVPHLLDEPLKIIQAGSLSYEQFCAAARKLTFDHQIVGWSKVALLCHFAREVAIIGELDDTQLELLAEHSLRFIQESTSEWIEKKGGWVSNCVLHFILFVEGGGGGGGYPSKLTKRACSVWLKDLFLGSRYIKRYGLDSLDFGFKV